MTDDQAISEFYDQIKKLEAVPTEGEAHPLVDSLLEKSIEYTKVLTASLLELFKANPPTTPEWKALFELYVLFEMTTAAIVLSEDNLAFSPIAAAKHKRDARHLNLSSMLRSAQITGNTKMAEGAAKALKEIEEEEAKEKA